MDTAPTISGLDTALAFRENLLNGIAQLIGSDGAVVVSDPDSSDFDGGTLIVSAIVLAPPLVDQLAAPDDLKQDVIGLRLGDRITLTVGSVEVDGVAVATVVTDGRLGTPLELAFNASATAEIVRLLIANLTYQNLSDTPIAKRDIRIELTDGDGGTATLVDIAVDVLPDADAIRGLGGDRQANTETASNQDKPAIAALADGGFIIVWESDGQDGDLNGIFAQRFDADGHPVARDGTTLAAGLTDEFQINTTTLSQQFDPAIAAMPDGGFVISWTDFSALDGSGQGLFAKRFGADGAIMPFEGPVETGADDELRLNIETASHQFEAELAALKGVNAGTFVSVFTSTTSFGTGAGDGNGEGIKLRIFPPGDAAAHSDEFIVNIERLSDQSSPQVTALADGGFFVTWQSQSTTFDPAVGTIDPTGDGDGLGLFGLRYGADLAPASGEIPINQITSGSQVDPAVTQLTNGNIVVTWTDRSGLDGSGFGIYGRVLSPDGSPVADQFRVNDGTISNQQNADVTALDTGGFMVTWQTDVGFDGDSQGVFAQQYNADGSRTDGNIQVNTEFRGGQFEPAIAALADGAYVVAWTSTTEATAGDGDGNGVFYRTFRNTEPEVADVAASVDEDTELVLGFDLFAGGFSDADGHTLKELRIDSLPTEGVLTLDGAAVAAGQTIAFTDLHEGDLTYLGAQDFNGFDSFAWTASDGFVFADPVAQVNITVDPVNDAPGLEAGLDATEEEFTGFAREITLTDPDDQVRTFTVDFGDGSEVETFDSADLTLLLQHTYRVRGVHTVTVTVDDKAGAANSVETDTFDVTIVNRPPRFLFGNSIVFQEDDLEEFFAFQTSDPTEGQSNNVVRLVEFNGIDLTDPANLLDPIQITEGPLAGASLSFVDASDVLGSVFGEQPGFGPAIVRPQFLFSSNGAFENLREFGTGFPSIIEDQFSFTIVDRDGAATSEDFTITVRGRNDTPVAADDVLSTDAGTLLEANVLADNGNGVDADPDAVANITVTELNGNTAAVGQAITLASGATVLLAADGSLTYDPTTVTTPITEDSFTYTINDGQFADSNDTATVFITLENVNEAPVAAEDALVFAEDELFANGGGALGLLIGNDSDPDGDAIEIVAITGGPPSLPTEPGVLAAGIVSDTGRTADILVLPVPGTLPDGNQFDVVFTPTRVVDGDVFGDPMDDLAEGETERFTFSYAISDGALTDTAEVTITVVGQNDAPVAVDDVATLDEDMTGVFDVLANDSDIDGDTLSLVAVISSAGGTAEIADGAIAFTPDADFSGPAIVGYSVTDGFETVNATLSIDILPVNDAPVATNDAFTFAEDDVLAAGGMLFGEVSANDLDPDGDALEIVGLTSDSPIVELSPGFFQLLSAGGRSAILSSQTGVDGRLFVTLQPAGFENDELVNRMEDLAAGETDTFSFSYTVSDGSLTDTADVTFTFAGENDAPVAEDLTLSTAEDTVLTFDPLSNASDLDGDTLSVGAITAVSGGTALLDAGQMTFTPEADFFGTAIVGYTVMDGVDTVETTATITVTPVNDAPVILSETFEIEENASLVGQVAVTDVDEDPLATGFEITGGADANLFLIDVDGALRFAVAPDFEAPEDANLDNVYEVEVTATDAGSTSGGASASATKTLLVSVLDDPDDEAPELIPVTGSNGLDILLGTSADEVYRPGAGLLDLISLFPGGADTIEFGDETSNSVREVDIVIGFGPDDSLDLGGASILREINRPFQTTLILDGDNDRIILIGVSDFDEITQLV